MRLVAPRGRRDPARDLVIGLEIGKPGATRTWAAGVPAVTPGGTGVLESAQSDQSEIT